MRFEWDAKKDLLNRRKHSVNFEDAATAFFDEYGVVIGDPDHSYHEERFLLLGLTSKLKLLVICFCDRKGGNVIRIISARKANKAEVITYWNRR